LSARGQRRAPQKPAARREPTRRRRSPAEVPPETRQVAAMVEAVPALVGKPPAPTGAQAKAAAERYSVSLPSWAIDDSVRSSAKAMTQR
jgi:hypothetical protein